MKMCKEDDCDKRAISFSDYCGAHTDDEAYGIILNSLAPKIYSEIYISEMVVSTVDIKGLHFFDSTIEDCEFVGGSWVDIHFDFSSLKSCYFSQVDFYDLVIDTESICASNTFEDCRFDRFIAKTISISNGEFRSSTLSNTTFDTSLLSRIDFLDCSLSDLKILVSGFDTVSFQHCTISDSYISDIKLSVTFCLDTLFTNVGFSGELIHDFHSMSDPFELCLFQDCKIDWDLSLDGFSNWNAIDEDSLSFYWRVLDRIANVVHIDNLSPLQFLVARVQDLTEDSFPLAVRLRDIFSSYFADVKERQDLSGLGKLASLISRLPKEVILDKAKYLPSPKTLGSKNVLRIEVEYMVDTLSSLYTVISRLERLDAVILHHDLDPMVVEDFKKGSVTIVLSTTVVTIMVLISVLYKAGHLFLDTENKVLTNKDLKHKAKNQKKEDKLLDQNLTLNSQRIVLNDLEIQKRKMELQALNQPDKFVPVSAEEMIEYTGEDPFDRLELKAYDKIKSAAEEVLELGETNVYIEIIEQETNEIK